jgi:solute carrier family 35 protein E3
MEDIVSNNLIPIGYCLFNIISVTGIVIVNKKVFNDYEFHFPITLVMIHTIITFLGLSIAAQLGIFDRKSLPVQPRVILAASFVFYNAASLVNLNVNTVGFYQISKILITPMVMAVNLLAYNEGTSMQVKMAVAIMLMGVTMATVTDVQVGMGGFLVGMEAVVGAAQQQILIGKMQSQLQASANQLLVSYTPFVVVMLASCTPIDLQLKENTGKGYAAFSEWNAAHGSTAAYLVIVLSGCLGLLVSLSTFLLIGATSPLTYNIVGHLKTVSILTMGVIFFNDSMSTKKFGGICLALIGVIMYSKIKLEAAMKKKQQPPKSTSENPAS